MSVAAAAGPAQVLLCGAFRDAFLLTMVKHGHVNLL